MSRRLALVLGLVVLPSCADDPPPDVEGEWAVEVSSESDDCSLDGFTDGASTITLTQDDDDPTMLSADINGAIAPFLGLDLGGTEFTGSIDGSAVSLSRTGTQRQTVGCTWHVNAEIDAVITADDIEGTIAYTGIVTFETADCPFEDDCTSSQSFVGGL